MDVGLEVVRVLRPCLRCNSVIVAYDGQPFGTMLISIPTKRASRLSRLDWLPVGACTYTIINGSDTLSPPIFSISPKLTDRFRTRSLSYPPWLPDHFYLLHHDIASERRVLAGLPEGFESHN